MTLIIETGAIVADANTYLDETQAALILLETFGITALITEPNLLAATRYLESFGAQYQGEKVSPATQSLQFPRINVFIDNCRLLPSDAIPLDLKRAQALAAFEELQGNTLQPTTTGQVTTSKSIAGQISTTKNDTGLSGLQFTQVRQYLKPLFKKLNAQSLVTRA